MGERDINLPSEVLDQATKCLKHQCCLRSKERDVCDVDYSVHDDVVFIRSREMSPCFYYNCFGTSHFCACPVRKKLHFYYSI